jgi:hypothetical protein
LQQRESTWIDKRVAWDGYFCVNYYLLMSISSAALSSFHNLAHIYTHTHGQRYQDFLLDRIGSAFWGSCYVLLLDTMLCFRRGTPAISPFLLVAAVMRFGDQADFFRLGANYLMISPTTLYTFIYFYTRAAWLGLLFTRRGYFVSNDRDMKLVWKRPGGLGVWFLHALYIGLDSRLYALFFFVAFGF